VLLRGARAEDAPLRLVDRHVVDARLAPAHEAVVVELPQLVAVAAEPLAGRVVAFVLEAHRDPVPGERPEALAEGVVELSFPLGGEERDDLVASGDEGVAVAPDGVGGVGAGDSLRIPGVPGVLGRLDLLGRGLDRERRQWRAVGHEGER
jgi:hypothetical protein